MSALEGPSGQTNKLTAGIVNIQLYPVNTTLNDQRYASAMDRMVSENKGTNAILTSFYASPESVSGQMDLRGLKPFEILNLEYRPGVFFNVYA